MSELLPTVQARNIRSALIDYLTTTFALSDADVRDGLDRFLSDPVTGMFKGPYVRLRMPFRPAASGWRDLLGWYEGVTPYSHQAAAFARLSSSLGGRRRRPQPTLVTTGTGSGKTEAFLYPIVDHVLRARRDGITGTKALILYPMNALANDQAARLTSILTSHAELGGVTAALYTGQSGATRTSVTADGLITDRAVIRDTSPDILLTNYKMLDQLLLRHEDQDIWRQSATSLQYLVLDEFHTYDGAQGTDVAMLLRRLGIALKSHWPAEDLQLSEDDRRRPLGRITPVATSATLGDKGDPESMLGFSTTVFGEQFTSSSVVTESRLSMAEWTDGAVIRVAALGLEPVEKSRLDIDALDRDIGELGPDPAGSAVAGLVFRSLYAGDAAVIDEAPPARLLDLARAHPVVQELAASASDAVPIGDLAAQLAGRGGADRERWESLVGHLIAALGHVRAVAGRQALSIDAHLWVRELTRIDRHADATARFRWGDDGPPTAGEDLDDIRPAFPAIYCRHCGRSGWGVTLAPVGDSLSGEDEAIRRSHAAHEGRFRALLHAPAEGDAPVDDDHPIQGLRWVSFRARCLLSARPPEGDPDLVEGWILPVLTTVGKEGDQEAKDDTCPSCGQEDGIRFLGSAIATLLSVSLSTLFGSAELDPAEKKALVFTDSVQDAAHRAGFVQARSHTLTLRAVFSDAIGQDRVTLDGLVGRVLERAGDDPFARYRILPPDCADRDSFAQFWKEERPSLVPARVRRRVRTRLALDAALEFGLNSRLGRTLELTGTIAAEVDAGTAEDMAALARDVLRGVSVQSPIGAADAGPDQAALTAWVRGVVDRMRSRGAIEHEWFDTYRDEDGNRWSIWGGRGQRRADGMPAFPRGRPAPAYPRIGAGAADGLDPVTSPKSWNAEWTARALSVSAADGGLLARLLLEKLCREDVLTSRVGKSQSVTYALAPSRIVLVRTRSEDLAARRHLLMCDTCHDVTPGSTATVDQLDGAPCLVLRCRGRLQRAVTGGGFYRRLYSSTDMRRVVAREHTSLLPDEWRLEYETGFKSADPRPDSPNVLVATPTLEMGIDIGDLSAVLLASLPRTVASYLQRVGRAGRLTGNALNLAYVTGRGDQLPKLGDPLSVINGEVRPPATYLRAEEILRRQFTAHLVDEFARDSGRRHPFTAAGAIGSSAPDSFLGDLIAHAELLGANAVDRFLDTFDDVDDQDRAELLDWVTAPHGPGTSGFAVHVHGASQRWQTTVATLKFRAQEIEKALPELEAKASSPAATDTDKRALRSARAARALTLGQLGHLQGEYWIGVLEEHGLLPNYTLLDDTVTLDVGLSWTDPDTNTFQTDHAQFQRGSAQAIREFAPGATFYAQGWEIEIDAIDLGLDGTSVRSWVLCPDCGFGIDPALGGTPVLLSQCPRCGSPGIADTGQRLDLVDLTHVTAEIRRDEAAISDRSDQRTVKPFQVVVTADVDPTHITRRWFADGIGLGCTYLRSVDVRWLNLGVPGHGTARMISGEEHGGALFRVCDSCGKLDTQLGRNAGHEHRPWCRHRDSAAEHHALIAAVRTLRTQGLLVRLPFSVTIGDPFAVPSLSAALLLGLREQVGGQPDHIRVERVTDPTLADGTQNHDGLLLHDVVPGGTGYLAELADPVRLRDLLTLAWRTVRDCECRHEDRMACHRCLLPFVASGAIRRVSRASAERHLRTLLGFADPDDDPDALSWTITESPPTEDIESHLEQRFREVFIDRLTTLGATVNQVPGPTGNTVRFTIPGSPRQWTLTPQVNLENSKPDFVLESTDTSLPAIAIFTDGRAFHASPLHNRLADDAAKREILRDTGRMVVAITAKDVDGPIGAPAWFSDERVGQLIALPPFMAHPAAYQALRLGPVDRLLDWVASPSPSDTRMVARAVPLFLTDHVQTVTTADDLALAAVARAVLLGESVPAGSRAVAVRIVDSLAVAIEQRGPVFDVAVVLDDRGASLDDAHASSWREWLRLSNDMALRDWLTVITTVTRVSAASQAKPEIPVPDLVMPTLPVEWRAAWVAASPGAERELVAALAGSGAPPPEVGPEGPGGIPLDIAWPERRLAVVVHHLDDADLAELASAGWTVLDPDPTVILRHLTADR